MPNWFEQVFKPRPAPYLALAEYWIYLDSTNAPSQDDVMTRMVQANPFAKGGKLPITPRESLLWSDVRFHMGVARREKNAHIFRPDLFEPHVEPSAELLQALGEAQALVKVRYASEQPLPDKRHLQFLVYVAESVAALSEAKVIFDLSGERLFSAEWLRQQLEVDPDATRKDVQVRCIWRRGEVGGTAETRGLGKIGLPELCTPETMEDHRVVAMQVLEEAADQIWDLGQVPEKLSVDAYGDRFHVVLERKRRGPCGAKILREAG